MDKSVVFVGRYSEKVSEGGSVKIPNEWAVAFPPGSTAYVVQSLDSKSLCLLTPDAMTKFTAEVGPKALFDPEVKAALDKLGEKSEAQTVNADGTLALSGAMRAYANIEESAEFVGVFRFARIWKPSALPLEHDSETDAEIGKALEQQGF